jgi:hypothetical protein
LYTVAVQTLSSAAISFTGALQEPADPVDVGEVSAIVRAVCAVAALVAIGAACTKINPAYQVGATPSDAAPPPSEPVDTAADLGAPPSADAASVPTDAAPVSIDAAMTPVDSGVGPPDLVIDSSPPARDTTPDLAVVPVAMSGLVGYWPFDDGPGSPIAADASSNHLDGMLMALDRQTSWEGGYVGGAIRFPLGALDAGVELPLTALVRNIQRFTFSAWIRHLKDDGNHHAILSRQWGGTSREVYGFGFDGPLLFLYLVPPTPGDTIELKATVAAIDTWVHVAATYDGTTIRLFVGGKQIAEKPHALALAPSDKPIYLGTNKNVGAPNQPWDGWLDEITIWSVALPEARIGELASGRHLMLVP